MTNAAYRIARSKYYGHHPDAYRAINAAFLSVDASNNDDTYVLFDILCLRATYYAAVAHDRAAAAADYNAAVLIKGIRIHKQVQTYRSLAILLQDAAIAYWQDDEKDRAIKCISDAGSAIRKAASLVGAASAVELTGERRNRHIATNKDVADAIARNNDSIRTTVAPAYEYNLQILDDNMKTPTLQRLLLQCEVSWREKRYDECVLNHDAVMRHLQDEGMQSNMFAVGILHQQARIYGDFLNNWDKATVVLERALVLFHEHYSLEMADLPLRSQYQVVHNMRSFIEEYVTFAKAAGRPVEHIYDVVTRWKGMLYSVVDSSNDASPRHAVYIAKCRYDEARHAHSHCAASRDATVGQRFLAKERMEKYRSDYEKTLLLSKPLVLCSHREQLLDKLPDDICILDYLSMHKSIGISANGMPSYTQCYVVFATFRK
jgi:hypothetical protein